MGLSQKPLRDDSQHPQVTYTDALDRIRTNNPSKRAALDLGLRQYFVELSVKVIKVFAAYSGFLIFQVSINSGQIFSFINFKISVQWVLCKLSSNIFFYSKMYRE